MLQPRAGDVRRLSAGPGSRDRSRGRRPLPPAGVVAGSAGPVLTCGSDTATTQTVWRLLVGGSWASYAEHGGSAMSAQP